MQLPSTPTRFFFKGQMVHLLLLIILLVGAFLLVDFKQLRESQFLGISTQVWFVVSLAVPVVHQVYVWLTWRSELCFGTVTKRLGSHAFVIYQTVFMVFLLARPVSITLLSIADHDSFELSFGPLPSLGLHGQRLLWQHSAMGISGYITFALSDRT